MLNLFIYLGFNKRYDTEKETVMLLYYSRLSEEEHRHYASLVGIKLGYDSKRYVQNLFKISPDTIIIIYQQTPLGKQRRVTFIDTHKAGMGVLLPLWFFGYI